MIDQINFCIWINKSAHQALFVQKCWSILNNDKIQRFYLSFLLHFQNDDRTFFFFASIAFTRLVLCLFLFELFKHWFFQCFDFSQIKQLNFLSSISFFDFLNNFELSWKSLNLSSSRVAASSLWHSNLLFNLFFSNLKLFLKFLWFSF